MVIEITDTGEGMPAHVAQRATEPFFTTKGVGKGTGLGLAMAAGFVQQSRGRLDIQSREGEGATIRFLFPAIPKDEATAPEPPPATAPESPQTSEGAGQHILLVEDQEEVRDLARQFLESGGYRVTAAANGDEGAAILRALAQTDPIALVFTDILMPGGLNGLQLAQVVAAEFPTIPVLLTTGYNEDLAVLGPERRGMDVLGKPYRRAQLLDRIREGLGKKHGGGPRRRASDFGPAEG